MTPDPLTHFDEKGRAQMVDISDKAVTTREARAQARIEMQPETLTRIKDGTMKKGDVLGVARIAGIMAAKKTADLIPMCHLLSLSSVKIEFTILDEENTLVIDSYCRLNAQTGVEMEALCAVSISALSVYDMCKAIDRSMCITHTRLLEKTGGKSGDWQAEQLCK